MSPNKSWKLRTSLTLGATALAVAMSGGVSIAAGHGREAMGAMRGAGIESVRNTNQRFESIAVVRLPSPVFNGPAAGFQKPSVVGPRVITETPGAPVTTSPKRIIEPRVIPRDQPDQMPNGPAADVHGPSPAVRGLIQDPVAPSVDARQPTDDAKSPSPTVRRLIQDPVAPSVDARQPTDDAKGASPTVRRLIQDPVAPSVDARQPTDDAKAPSPTVRRLIQDPVAPSVDARQPGADAKEPSPTVRRLIQDPVAPSVDARQPAADAKGSPSPQARQPAPVAPGPVLDPLHPTPDHVIVHDPASN